MKNGSFRWDSGELLVTEVKTGNYCIRKIILDDYYWRKYEQYDKSNL